MEITTNKLTMELIKFAGHEERKEIPMKIEVELAEATINQLFWYLYEKTGEKVDENVPYFIFYEEFQKQVRETMNKICTQMYKWSNELQQKYTEEHMEDLEN